MTRPLANEFTVVDDFPAVEYEQWRAVVEGSLSGALFDRKLVTQTHEQIDIQPVYTHDDAPGDDDPLGFPGSSPFVRGSCPLGAVQAGWDLRQEHRHPDITTANQQILADLRGGVTSLHLRFNATTRCGLDPDDQRAAELLGGDGLLAYGVDDFDALLDGVDLQKVPIAIDAGGAFLPASACLMGVWQRRGLDLAQVRGALNADPLQVLAAEGRLPLSLDQSFGQLADLTRWTAQRCPKVMAVGVDTSPYHDAGATAVQDLAFAVATGVEYLRRLTHAGLDIHTSATQIQFRLGLGTHHFMAIAKLRAARQMWARVCEACGTKAAGGMRIHARTSNRVLTQRDPYVNLLRNTVAVFAAALGGADAITSIPFDSRNHVPDEFSLRIARNTPLVLQAEAHLNRVIDPAGGSWYLDQLTEQLASKAWSTFQQIEQLGGMAVALASGWAGQQIEESHAARASAIAHRKQGITGVSEFPDVHEDPVRTSSLDMPALLHAAIQRTQRQRMQRQRTGPANLAALNSAEDPVAEVIRVAQDGATLGQIAGALGFKLASSFAVTPMAQRSFAQPFEELRDASDAWTIRHGRRPSVLLVNMGTVAQFTARATFAKNFFEAGGFDVLGNEGFGDSNAAAEALANSRAAIAVICSSDEQYRHTVTEWAAKLKAAGARSVVLAGHPGDNESAWRAAGVDRFIYMKCNALQTLSELLREEGVLGDDTK